jgi:hypothetical protein
VEEEFPIGIGNKPDGPRVGSAGRSLRFELRRDGYLLCVTSRSREVGPPSPPARWRAASRSGCQVGPGPNCSTTGQSTPPCVYDPAAHTSVLLNAEIEVKVLAVPVFGALTTCHDDPFQ